MGLDGCFFQKCCAHFLKMFIITDDSKNVSFVTPPLANANSLTILVHCCMIYACDNPKHTGNH